MASIPETKATAPPTSSSLPVNGMWARIRWRSSKMPAAVVAGMERRKE